ncbi:MAG: mannose-6-phosphate isomerase type [Candidatus Saccharibacteria bacterium]|nr:mannose-6-phosphate isomerase type [Candidatus Saccharibacteria bacterium]
MADNIALDLGAEPSKEVVFTEVAQYMSELGLRATAVDSERPWGGFYVIDESLTGAFIDLYFPEFPRDQISKYGNKLSPKLLIVAPEKRLSWQYHDRRAELWKAIYGPVGYIVSETQEQGIVLQLAAGETIQFDPRIYHRLIGLEGWGVVAEIWQHSDPSNPSDELDIVRVEDDFGR